MNKQGILVSFEGIDGAGKSSLVEGICLRLKRPDVLSLREPGGTPVSEMIRELLLDSRNQGILSKTEALLYAAARNQVVEEIIAPALNEGKIVLIDRYIDSTIAYQGYGRGLDISFLEIVNQICTGGLKPDLTLLLDLDPLEGHKRKKKDIPDRLEKEGISFQYRVRDGYLEIARKEAKRVKVLDAVQDRDSLVSKAMEYIQTILD
jgi:dTMP kinase